MSVNFASAGGAVSVTTLQYYQIYSGLTGILNGFILASSSNNHFFNFLIYVHSKQFQPLAQ